ncbi:phosphatidylglycerol lysyltransferase domain-containing protein [Herbidospora mongoliensis]|uniref:phosphatidylglycerol lysyltransferase domain-containing protein n=1 Tax=Herbidospora mongoliensis TaxID=688067 RepID=UPI0008318046|nr:phosphatidylglycerol lysyltransferase domain-containing protein [Herbidospora mongoliensis]
MARGDVPRVASIVLTVLAICSAAIAIVPSLRRVARPLTELINDYTVPLTPNLAYAAFLGLLAGALARRKRVAWWLLVGLLAFSVLLSIIATPLLAIAPMAEVPDRDRVLNEVIVSGVVALFLIAYLWWGRAEFFAKVQPASVRKAVATMIGLLGVSYVVGYLLTIFFPGDLLRSARAVWVLSRTLGGVIEVEMYGHPSAWISFVIGLISAIALLVAFAVLFRSQRQRAVLAPDEEERLRALLGERDSLAYFATRRDRSVIFSPSGKAAVSFRVVNGVTLAGGDPLGDPEAWDHAIRAWTGQAREFGWIPAAIGAGAEGARAYQRAGLKVLELGDEAVIEVKRFNLQGREMRGVRQAVNRVERAGYQLRIRRHGDLAPEEMRLISERADAWRDTETERGFSMALGRLGDPRDAECVLVESLTKDGDEAALLSFVPWGDRGLSLDLMRRDRSAENGLIEFMVAGLVRNAGWLGVERVSLNFAVFRSAFEEGARMGAGPVIRAWRRTLLFLSRWWQLEALYRANVKYRPEWVPRFLAYGDTRDLVRVGIASAIAEGFFSPPRLPRLLNPGRTPTASSAAPGSDAARPAR